MIVAYSTVDGPIPVLPLDSPDDALKQKKIRARAQEHVQLDTVAHSHKEHQLESMDHAKVIDDWF